MFTLVFLILFQDSTYWNHIYNPSRLQFLKSNMKVTGRVAKVIKETDGDLHIWVKRPNVKELLNVEIICMNPGKPACKGYVNSIKAPTKGDSIQVVGDYVYDKSHGWYEIHPVKRLKVIH